MVPVGLQRGGDQAVVGVDGQVAPSGQLGGVAGSFHLGAAQPVGLLGARRQLVGDGQGDLQGHRADGCQQQLAHGVVDAAAEDGLAAGGGGLDAGALTDIDGGEVVAALLVAHGHALPATSADHQSLQQGWAFAGRAGAAVLPMGRRAGGQAALVVLELLPAEIADVRVGDERDPVLAGLQQVAGLPVGAAPRAARISVPGSAQISDSRCQSALLRASRETSRPSTMPARPMPTSATSRWKPSRPWAEAPERPRSSSITITCSAGQPNATARSRSAYWRSVEVVFSTTCRRVDWRTYR